MSSARSIGRVNQPRQFLRGSPLRYNGDGVVPVRDLDAFILGGVCADLEGDGGDQDTDPPLTDAKQHGDLLIGQPRRDVVSDFMLSRREVLEGHGVGSVEGGGNKALIRARSEATAAWSLTWTFGVSVIRGSLVQGFEGGSDSSNNFARWH